MANYIPLESSFSIEFKNIFSLGDRYSVGLISRIVREDIITRLRKK
jgi:hypothetical protein